MKVLICDVRICEIDGTCIRRVAAAGSHLWQPSAVRTPLFVTQARLVSHGGSYTFFPAQRQRLTAWWWNLKGRLLLRRRGASDAPQLLRAKHTHLVLQRKSWLKQIEWPCAGSAPQHAASTRPPTRPSHAAPHRPLLVAPPRVAVRAALRRDRPRSSRGRRPPVIRFPDRHFAGFLRVCALSIRTSGRPRDERGYDMGIKSWNILDAYYPGMQGMHRPRPVVSEPPRHMRGGEWAHTSTHELVHVVIYV